MKRHLYTHTREGLFKCKICDKTFSVKYQFQDHEKIHLESNKFECDYCKIRFNTKTDIQMHIQNNLKEKEFNCLKCRKSFTYLCNLQDHEKSHTYVKKSHKDVSRDENVSKIKSCYVYLVKLDDVLIQENSNKDKNISEIEDLDSDDNEEFFSSTHFNKIRECFVLLQKCDLVYKKISNRNETVIICNEIIDLVDKKPDLSFLNDRNFMHEDIEEEELKILEIFDKLDAVAKVLSF